MNRKHPPVYVERFNILYNRGPVRVEQEMEIRIDLATIRRLMGLYAASSKGRRSRAGHVKVNCVALPKILGKATSNFVEVACE